MLKTSGARLAAIMEKHHLDVTKMAAVLGITQPRVSQMLRSDGEFKRKYKDILYEKFRIRKEFLNEGGEMFDDATKVAEPDMPLLKPANRVNILAMGDRLLKVVEDYMHQHGLNQKEVAAQWQVNFTHLNGVIQGSKPMALKILLHAHVYGRVNLNYVASGEGGFYLGTANEAVLKRLADVEQVMHELKEDVSLLDKVPKKHHSG